MKIERFIELFDSTFQEKFINRQVFALYLQNYLEYDYVKIIFALIRGNMKSKYIAKPYVMQKLNKILEYIKHLHLDLIASEILSYENYVRYLQLKGEDK